MPQVSDLTPDVRFFGMFVSRSGDGKTCAGASFPRPIEIINCDDLRIQGLAQAKSFLGELKDISYKTFSPMGPTSGYQKILDHVTVLHDLINAGKSPIKTIQLSSITSLSRIFLKEAKQLIEKGRKTGGLRRAGPDDYGYESDATLDIFDLLRDTRCHVIVDAHVVKKFVKENPDDQYSQTVEGGEDLSIRQKLGENVLMYFNEVYRFSRDTSGQRFFVRFRSDLAKTSYVQLPNNEVEITNKPFFQVWKELIG